MSYHDQLPQQHNSDQNDPNIAESTPELKALHAQESVVPAPEHRDNKNVPPQTTESWIARHKKLTAGLVASAILTPISAGFAFHHASKAATDPFEDAGRANPGNSAPQTPGANSPETETGSSQEAEATSIQLTPEQASIYDSGSQEAINELNDKLVLKPLEKALNSVYLERVTGEAPDISNISTDPAVLKSLRFWASNMPEPTKRGAENAGWYNVGICPATDSSDLDGGPCAEPTVADPNHHRLSKPYKLGTPMTSLATFLQSPEHTNADGEDSRQDSDLNLMVKRNGDTLEFTTVN